MRLNTIRKTDNNIVQSAVEVSALFTLLNVLWEAQTKGTSLEVSYSEAQGLIRLETAEYVYDFESVPFTAFNDIACYEVYRNTLKSLDIK